MAVATPVQTENQLGNPTIEQWLRDRGVKFHYVEDFPLYQINREASLHNQARVGEPIIEDLVERYALAMAEDTEFPPIIVTKHGKNQYLVVDGNHRVQAADEAEKPLNAYVVDEASPVQILTLTFEANARHGEPTTTAEREQQAMSLIAQGASRSEAARLLGIKPSRLEYLQSDQQASERLAGLGYDPNAYSSAHRRRMHSIRSDVVFSAVADLVKSASMTFESLDKLVPRINAQRNEAQQMSVVAESRRENETVIRGSAGGTFKGNTRPIVRLNNIVTKVREFDVNSLPKNLDAVSRDQLRTAILDATRRMANIAEQLGN